ncbi:MAG: DUF7666 domain-containing protein [Acidobacteriaceae bacterium]
MSNRILAWHFLDDDGLDRNGNEVEIGQTTSVKGPIVICKHSLHWSERLIDALKYAPGSTLCRVEGWGDVERERDTGCSRHRKVLAKANIAPILHEFACRVAEQALQDAGVKDKRSWAAIETKRRWLAGDASDDELAAAEGAAWLAGDATTKELAAARSAAWMAAWESRTAAAEAAAWAVWSARVVRSAAAEVARERQNTLLTQMVMELPEFKGVAGE